MLQKKKVKIDRKLKILWLDNFQIYYMFAKKGYKLLYFISKMIEHWKNKFYKDQYLTIYCKIYKLTRPLSDHNRSRPPAKSTSLELEKDLAKLNIVPKYWMQLTGLKNIEN